MREEPPLITLQQEAARLNGFCCCLAADFGKQEQLASPLAEGLFRQAILQSGGGIENSFPKACSREAALSLGEMLIGMTGAESLAALREIPWQRLQETANRFYRENRSKGLPFVPVTDGYVLPEEPQAVLKEGKRNPVSCMLGATEDDISFGGDTSDLIRGCVRWAKSDIQNGLPADYLYYFKRKLPGDDAGAFHSSELWFVFETLSRAWRPFTEADHALAERMADSWCDFIKCGEPGWPPYTEENPCIKEWNTDK